MCLVFFFLYSSPINPKQRGLPIKKSNHHSPRSLLVVGAYSLENRCDFGLDSPSDSNVRELCRMRLKFGKCQENLDKQFRQI
jgi:hypothetical protein